MRLGDYGNDVQKFMMALEQRVDRFRHDNWGMHWYGVKGFKVVRHHVPTLGDKVRAWWNGPKRSTR